MNKKEYRTDVNQRLKGSNFFTETTQLSLPWQRWRFKMVDTLALKVNNTKKISDPQILFRKIIILS